MQHDEVGVVLAPTVELCWCALLVYAMSPPNQPNNSALSTRRTQHSTTVVLYGAGA